MDSYNAAGLPFLTSDLPGEESAESEDEVVISDPEDSDYDGESVQTAKRVSLKFAAQKRLRVKKPLPPPLQKATILALASVTQQAEEENSDKVEKRIMARIMKCREKGMNNTTPEAEARTALLMASKLMEQHNISVVQISQGTPTTKSWEQGESRVRITRTRGKSLQVERESWLGDVASAVRMLFDVEYYYNGYLDRSAIDYTFFGIAQNSRMAAQAFEVVYNLIGEWARGKKRSSNNYCRGVAHGFIAIARETKEQEKREALESERTEKMAILREEHLQRQTLLSRLKDPPVAIEEDRKPDKEDDTIKTKPDFTVKIEDVSDEDDNVDDISADALLQSFMEPALGEPFKSSIEDPKVGSYAVDGSWSGRFPDDTFARHGNPPASRAPEEDPADDWSVEGSLYDTFGVDLSSDDSADKGNNIHAAKEGPISENAVTRYHREAQDVAQEMLKAKKIKIVKSKYFGIRDYNAYEDGRRDARDIDVKRKRIEDANSEGADVKVRVKRAKDKK